MERILEDWRGLERILEVLEILEILGAPGALEEVARLLVPLSLAMAAPRPIFLAGWIRKISKRAYSTGIMQKGLAMHRFYWFWRFSR